MREALAGARPGELERGVCLVGPHRDELELRVGELPARGYASHGESWSLALALRLAAYELLRADGEDPVLILDDVFAELDAGRRDRLAVLVAAAEQVLIVTAAVPADVPAALHGRALHRPAGGSPVPGIRPQRRPGAAGRPERLRRAVAALAEVNADARARGDCRPAGARRGPERPMIPNGPACRGRQDDAPGPGARPGGQRNSRVRPRSRRARRDDPQPLAARSAACSTTRAGRNRRRWVRCSATGRRSSGHDLAAHTRPDSFADGELVVAADSTAWATQVRLLASVLVRRLNAELGDGTVRRVKVSGPAPPRQRGGWRVPGSRAHGDTYG